MHMHSLYVEKYIKDEDSPWLVFLHGFGGSTKMWKRQLNDFRDHYNLLLLDLPGHGQSRASVAALGMQRFEDVADLVVHTLIAHGVLKAGFVCASVGTLVFAAIQQKYPAMVTGAVLCGAVAGVSQVMRLALAFLDRTKGIFPYTMLLNMFAHLLLPLASHAKSRKFFIESGRLLGRMEFMAWFSLAVRDLDALKNINTSLKNVYFISGTEDFTFLRGVKKTFGTVKGVHMTLLQHCGHVCSLQRPREFNDLSLQFLDASIPSPALMQSL